MAVRSVPCLCPERHAILALAYESEDGLLSNGETAVDVLRESIRRVIENRSLNPWCGLCAAEPATWTFEDAATRFRTMAEAQKHLRESESEQLRAAELIRRKREAAAQN